jgi:pimeloyl-ACP methyl ester carboxylesterase
MDGTLFRWGGSANVAFKTGAHRRHLILVGGLTDGLMFAPYVHPLARRLDSAKWSLVQTLLSSSHQGWGLASLDSDAEELLQLARCLGEEHGSQGIAIMGHSTGCQDAVRYALRWTEQRTRCSVSAVPPLLATVLQAPVSDREWLATQPQTASRLELAYFMLTSGRGEEVAFRANDIDGAAVSARRWWALAAKGGDDDMFSSDMEPSELFDQLRGLTSIPTLVVLSGADEYVPEHVDYQAVFTKMVEVIGDTVEVATLEAASHACSGQEESLASLVADFLCKNVE